MEFFIALAASLSGFATIILCVISVRAWWNGQSAYNANKRVTYRSLLRTFRGEMRDPEFDNDGRMSHGLAINLKTGKLQAQRRLSAEAIDDVIGRRV
jgi:hypothetical protein